MKNRKFLAIISLLLALVMVLASCQPVVEYEEDTPITAEAKFENFIKLEAPDNDVLANIKLISDEFGELVEAHDDIALFYDESKDVLNNLTETYTLYSISEAKALVSVKNTYPDEYGWTNDFGHMTYPEKEITDAYLVGENTINGEEFYYLVVEWDVRTPIDEETVKNEDLAESYVLTTYRDFYDMTGAFIASSSVAYEGSLVAADFSHTYLSFGKTVAVFDEDGKVVETYDGDVNSTPLIYDHMNERYNYRYVPYGVTDDTQMFSRFILEVYDKEGNLVCEYINGEYSVYANPFVLENGDVLIQRINITESIDYDYEADGTLYNVDTFLLAVETGAVTTLKDFGYILFSYYNEIFMPTCSIIYAEDFEDEIVEGFVAAENARNIIVGALDMKTKKTTTLFFDNFGNVNYTFDYDIQQEMSANDRVVKVLDNGYMLVEISSGVTDKAIINADSFIAHVPNGAYVLEDYIIAGDIRLNIKMERLGEVTDLGLDAYEIVGEPRIFGNCMAYNVIDEYDPGDGSGITRTNSVIIYNAESNQSYVYSDSTIYYSANNGMGGFIVIRKQSDNQNNYMVINGIGETVFTTPNCGYIRVYEAEDAVFVVVDGDRVYLITEKTLNEEVKE